MKTEKIPALTLAGKPYGYFIKNDVLPGEIEGLIIEYFSIKGAHQMYESSKPDHYDVLLSLNGNASLHTRKEVHEIQSKYIVKIPYNEQYSIKVEKEKVFYLLRFRKKLDENDRHVISQNRHTHSSVYIKAFSDCPVYIEEIKSRKSVNKMILPEGVVPRFCMGSVETKGPDLVGEHEHAMLEQLFFGLDNCNCTCYADGKQTVLTENMFLHIPLGSKHSVSVADGENLFYLWLDFFLTLEGQKYMDEEHLMVDK
jgi:hypothetical protein